MNTLVLLVLILIASFLCLLVIYCHLTLRTKKLMEDRIIELEELLKAFNNKLVMLQQDTTHKSNKNILSVLKDLKTESAFIKDHLADAIALKNSFSKTRYPFPFLRPILFGQQSYS